MKKIVIPLLLFCLFLQGCEKTTWDAYYYPDGTMVESTWVVQKGFATKEACFDFIDRQIVKNPGKINDYECGKNCKYKEEYGMDVCETTEK